MKMGKVTEKHNYYSNWIVKLHKFLNQYTLTLNYFINFVRLFPD